MLSSVNNLIGIAFQESTSLLLSFNHVMVGISHKELVCFVDDSYQTNAWWVKNRLKMSFTTMLTLYLLVGKASGKVS